MRKSIKTLYASLCGMALFLTGCADFKDTPGKSVWSEGLWALPWLTGIASAVFFFIAYKGSKSGSYVKVPDPDRPGVPGAFIEVPDDKNVPIYEFGQFWFGVGLFIATVFIIWNVISNK